MGNPTAIAPVSPKVWFYTTISTSPKPPTTTTLQAWDVEQDNLTSVILNMVGRTARFKPKSSSVAVPVGHSTMDVVFTPNTGFVGTGTVLFYLGDGNNANTYYNITGVHIEVGSGNGPASTIASAPAL